MKDDGSVHIGTEIDTSGAESGLRKLQAILQKIGNNSAVKGLANIGMAITGIGTAAGTAGKVMSTMVKTAKDLANTYKEDARAEKQLEVSAKTNPYLSGESVEKLKDYAGELQNISSYGAGDLLPFMASLASAGRNEAEIMDIMTAAVDASASGMISLDSAVQGLNMSYSGQVGMLGKLLPQVKSMTSEQLANGEAVKFIKQNYAGMSKEISDTTGSSEKLANAWNDLKSALGAGFNALIAPMEKFFTWAITNVTELVNKMNKVAGWDSGSTTTVKLSDQIKKDLDDLIDQRKVSEREMADAQARLEEERAKEAADATKAAANEQAQAYIEAEKKRKEQLQATVEQAKKDYASATANVEKIEKEFNEKWADYVEKYATKEQRKAYKKALKKYNTDIKKATNAQTITERSLTSAESSLNIANKTEETQVVKTTSTYEKQISDEKAKQAVLQEQINEKTKEYEAQKKKEEELAYDENTDRVSAINTYNETIEKLKKQIQYRRESGEVITQEQENQELLNAKVQAYINARASAKENLTDADPWVVATEKELQSLNGEVIAKDYVSQSKSALQELKDQLEQQLVLLRERKALLEGQGLDTSEIEKAISKVELTLKTADFTSFMSKIEKVMSQVSEYTEKLADGISSAISLAQENVDAQEEYELASLDRQYEKGLITAEEYNKQKEKIEKEAAEKSYQLDMYNWELQILQATASGAMAVVQALSSSGSIYANIAMAGIAATMAGLQIGTIIASKPTPPSFATGGIVQGSSYTGDKIQANVNSAEMILTQKQQKQLWNMANGKGGNGGNTIVNIPIENTASDLVDVKRVETDNGYKLIIQKAVLDGLNNGVFNSGLKRAQSTFNGRNYTN